MELTCEVYLKTILSGEFTIDCAMKNGLLEGGLYRQAKKTRQPPKLNMQATKKPTGAPSIASCCETRPDCIPIKFPPC